MLTPLIIGLSVNLTLNADSFWVLCRAGAPFFLVHRALFHHGCTCLGVHHAGSLKNKGAGTCIEITSSGELVTLRTVLLLHGGVYMIKPGGAELLILESVESEQFLCFSGF